MPEYPDIVVYVERLRAHVLGEVLEEVRLGSPFVLRTVLPPLESASGKIVREISHLGKRIVIALEDELFLVLHLMVAGRLRWKAPGVGARGKDVLAVMDFIGGSLVFTESGTRKRASLHVVRGRDALSSFDRGGLDVLQIDAVAFTERLRSARHTLKRSLTDPALFSGIGNAYSDEILFRARLSPVQLSTNLTDEEARRLHEAARSILLEWAERLRAEVGDAFPDRVTASHPEMAVHGRFGRPCPICGHPVQRIVHGDNESNYCAHCQTEGRLLADRLLSRLLKADWPKTVEELEERRR